MYDYDYYGSGYRVSSNPLSEIGDAMLAVTVISAVIALVLAIYFLSRRRYENSNRRPGLHGLFRFVNFDMYIFSAVQKYLYLFLTVFVIIGSFVMMFQDDGLLAGIVSLFVGPIVVRLAYELIYIIFAIRDQLASVNRTLLDIKQDGMGTGSASPYKAAYAAPERPANPTPRPAPAASRFCPKCGKEVQNGAPFCNNCGSRM